MKCYIHEDKEAVGTCVGCGKFICSECNTEIKGGKNYCKKCVAELIEEKAKIIEEKNKQIEKEQDKNQQGNPTVFMNAGGGGGGASSSSSGSGNGYRGYAPPYPRQSVLIHIVLFCVSAGIGNILYFLYVKSRQDYWNRTYR